MTTGSKYLGSVQLYWIVRLKRSDDARTESYKARTGSNFLGLIRDFISIEQIQHSSRMSFLVKKGPKERIKVSFCKMTLTRPTFCNKGFIFSLCFHFMAGLSFYLKKRQPGIRRNPVFLPPTSDLFGRSRDRRWSIFFEKKLGLLSILFHEEWDIEALGPML